MSEKPFDNSARRVTESFESNLIGEQVSHFIIVKHLGTGGMGQVYQALDTKLGRSVALKFLSYDLLAEPEARTRLVREAHAAAILNHPNICTVYEVGEVLSDDEFEPTTGVSLPVGTPFIAMEQIEGRSLSRLLAEEGPLDMDQFLDIAVQMAEGLAEAHALGVVHRDFKPQNVMVTGKGLVKILDFGLAKPLTASGLMAPSEEAVSAPLTQAGALLGTISYMSPEQALGKELDQRTDVFSMGVVLYEMATGRVPFQGRTALAVLNEIINSAPLSPQSLNPELPDRLLAVLEKCLQKEPALRYQSARDLAIELQQLHEPRPAQVPTPTRGVSTTWFVASLLGIAAVAMGSWLVFRPSEDPPATTPRFSPFTTDGGWKSWPRLSPDGERVAYVWSRGADTDIFVKTIGVGSRPLRLTDHRADEFSPAWSPDGREIAFVRCDRPIDRSISIPENSAAIYVVSSLGGHPRKIIDLEGPVVAGYLMPVLSWSPDGRWIAFAERTQEGEPSRIVRLSLETFDKQTMSSPFPGTAGDFYPEFSPDQKYIAFARCSSGQWGSLDIWVQPLADGEARRLTFGQHDHTGGLSWTPDSEEIIFTSILEAGSIWRVSLRGDGPKPIPVAGRQIFFAAARGDRLVYQEESLDAPDIYRVPGRRGSTEELVADRLIGSSQQDFTPSFSPDAQKIAFQSYRGGGANIWIANHDGSDPVQLTQFSKHTGTPRWSPDGQSIVFDSLESGNWDLYVIDAEGGMPRRLTHAASDDGTGTWSRDGQWIYFHSSRSGTLQIWKIPSEGGEATQVTTGGGFYGEESWDGEVLYFVRSHTSNIWRMDTEGGEEIQVTEQPVFWGDWSVAPTGIYFAISPGTSHSKDSSFVGYYTTGSITSTYTIHFLDFATREVTTWFQREGPYTHLFLAVSPHERWILFSEGRPREAELVLVEGFR